MSHSDSDSDSALLEECGNKRRKYNKNKAVVAAVIDAFYAEERGPNHVDEHPFSWSDHLHRMDAAEFKARYRLTHESFDALLARIRVDLCPTN